jgi:hypothetical protein
MYLSNVLFGPSCQISVFPADLVRPLFFVCLDSSLSALPHESIHQNRDRVGVGASQVSIGPGLTRDSRFTSLSHAGFGDLSFFGN